MFHLDNAFKSFLKNNKGFPKIKSRNSKNSYTTNAIYRNYKDKQYCNIELDLNNRLIKLPKIKWIKARGYYLHNITKNITDNYDIIVCEKLNTKNILQNKKLSKNICDASFYDIIRQLQYKSKYKNKLFYQNDPYYPSTQTCSVCEHIDSKYKNLNERVYHCLNCNNILDRDLNSSINIMFEGLKLYMKDKLFN